MIEPVKEIKTFEDLDVWVRAKDLSVLVYQLTDGELFRKDFGLKDQIRRASISVVSNIAEGYERNGNKEFAQFLSIAKGSAGEMRAQIHIAKELKYISETEARLLVERATEISKMLSGFINYLKQSDYKGSKFKS